MTDETTLPPDDPAPEAADSTAPGVTPKHLLIVGVLALLWNCVGAFDYVMTQFGNEAYMENFTPEQAEFFTTFPAWLVFFWATAIWSSVLGSVLLLMRKRLAAPVFMVSFFSMVITAIHNFVLENGAEIMGTGGAIFSVFIFVISLSLWLYARKMAEKGVLA